MTELLQSYLLQTGKLPLASIGMIEKTTVPAKYDVTERAFTPPSLNLTFTAVSEGESLPVQQVVGFLAQQLDLPEEEAFEEYHNYLKRLHHHLNEQQEYDWQPIGDFKKVNSVITFTQEAFSNPFESLSAEKIIREGVSHQMKVGDNETTTTAMEVFLNEEATEHDKWWLLPMLIALAAIALIIWKRYGS